MTEVKIQSETFIVGNFLRRSFYDLCDKLSLKNTCEAQSNNRCDCELVTLEGSDDNLKELEKRWNSMLHDFNGYIHRMAGACSCRMCHYPCRYEDFKETLDNYRCRFWGHILKT